VAFAAPDETSLDYYEELLSSIPPAPAPSWWYFRHSRWVRGRLTNDTATLTAAALAWLAMLGHLAALQALADLEASAPPVTGARLAAATTTAVSEPASVPART
jgi:hypothetical protein